MTGATHQLRRWYRALPAGRSVDRVPASRAFCRCVRPYAELSQWAVCSIGLSLRNRQWVDVETSSVLRVDVYLIYSWHRRLYSRLAWSSINLCLQRVIGECYSDEVSLSNHVDSTVHTSLALVAYRLGSFASEVSVRQNVISGSLKISRRNPCSPFLGRLPKVDLII